LHPAEKGKTSQLRQNRCPCPLLDNRDSTLKIGLSLLFTS
jgi:hypothetical protein